MLSGILVSLPTYAINQCESYLIQYYIVGGTIPCQLTYHSVYHIIFMSSHYSVMLC